MSDGDLAANNNETWEIYFELIEEFRKSLET